ncbi:hypothetical protein AAFF_G00235180 [Aldrovandia affinis]|uniref:Uncharacterized protein n=1 Tax=Aldrovandia affinis TaxID=143900 RepID=A0AAD7WUC3_9TELE|nr:hypothetical protein AAFF_G00235180 [Aldrovandia affinis]
MRTYLSTQSDAICFEERAAGLSHAANDPGSLSNGSSDYPAPGGTGAQNNSGGADHANPHFPETQLLEF